MQTKTKKILWKLLKVIWFIAGALILFWTLFWGVEIHLIQNVSVIIGIIFFVWGLGILGAYILITVLFLLIKWIVKIVNKLKKRKRK